MSKPIRIQRKRTKGWRMPPNTVSVCRPGKWGNPFFSKGVSNKILVDVFRRMLVQGHCQLGWFCTPRDAHEIRLRMIKNMHELRGKNLACFCPLDHPCHADVLLEIANEK